MNTLVKTLLITLLSLPSIVSAQKKFQFEAGLNYPFVLRGQGTAESHIGVYLSTTHRFANKPLSLKAKISYESYTLVDKAYNPATTNGRSLVLQSSINYNWHTGEQSVCYAGLGLGLSVDNANGGVFNEGHKTHLVLTPQVGVELWRHLHISAQYHITHPKTSRLMLSLGYAF